MVVDTQKLFFCGLCSQNYFFAPELFFDPARIFFFSPANKMRTVYSDTEELVVSWELKKRTRTKKICPSPQFGPHRGIGRFSLHAEFAWSVTDTMILYSTRLNRPDNRDKEWKEDTDSASYPGGIPPDPPEFFFIGLWLVSHHVFFAFLHSFTFKEYFLSFAFTFKKKLTVAAPSSRYSWEE